MAQLEGPEPPPTLEINGNTTTTLQVERVRCFVSSSGSTFLCVSGKAGKRFGASLPSFRSKATHQENIAFSSV